MIYVVNSPDLHGKAGRRSIGVDRRQPGKGGIRVDGECIVLCTRANGMLDMSDQLMAWVSPVGRKFG